MTYYNKYTREELKEIEDSIKNKPPSFLTISLYNKDKEFLEKLRDLVDGFDKTIIEKWIERL